jgi:hypothetical protein
MSNWTEALTRKQVLAARSALGAEMQIADHIQARRSSVDGWATIEVFVGRRCHTAAISPRGSVKSQQSSVIA